MGCVFSKASRGPPPPHVLYCRLPVEGQHSHMLEHVDMKKLTKLIRRSRLAPLYPHDVGQQADAMAEECPICTVAYPSMNTASCCSARVCTECFVYHQTASDPPGKAQCPFCKCSPFAVRYLGSKPKEQLQQEQHEQLAVKQQRRRKRLQQDLVPSVSDPAGPASTSADATALDVSLPPSPQQQSPQHHHDHHQQQQLPPSSHHQRQHSWLDELDDGDADQLLSRRMESINVFAGYHHQRTSSSSGGTAPDTATLHDTFSSSTQAAVAAAAAAGVGGVGAASAGAPLDLHQSYYYYDHQQQAHELEDNQQQQQLYPDSQLLELRVEQLSELRSLHQAGLLPEYAAGELSGLGLEELDEILLEQALMESMQHDCSPSRS